MIRAGHVTSVHPPFDVRIFHKECIALTRAGYEVTVIAPHDRNEIVQGVRLRAVPKPKTRFERMSRTIWHVFKTALSERIPIYHLHDPELIPIGILLKLSGRRVIYDVHENLPENILSKSYIYPNLKTFIAYLVSLAERLSAAIFDGTVAATPAIARRFPAKKTIVVQNFPILDELQAVELVPYDERLPVVTYVGAITAIRGIKEMIQAMNYVPAKLKAKLFLAGTCDSDLESEIRQMSEWDHVEFLGWLSRYEVARLLSSTRVGLVLLHPVGGYIESHPIKMFEYMASGIPVVASDFPLWREIIAESDCGILVDPLDLKAIAGAIQWLLEHPAEAAEMGRRGQEIVSVKYNWDSEAQKLKMLYRELSAPF